MAKAVVIGAGMGALAAAARLSVAGHQVCVYERSHVYGGAVRRYERAGFAFDTGPGLLQLPAVWRDLFIKTGRKKLEDHVETYQVDPASRHLFPDGTELTLPAVSRAKVITAIDSALGPGTGERWTDLVSRARTAWDATRRPLLEEPRTPHTSLANLPDPYPAQRRRGLLRRRQPTLAQLAEDELGEARLVSMLRSYALQYGLAPETAPASAAVLAYLEQTFGSWYVRGGIRALAEAVWERCLEREVAFHFGREVVRVGTASGRAVSVELADGERVPADFVVDGTGGRVSERSGREGGTTGGGPLPSRSHGGTGQSRHTLLLALRGGRESGAVHHTLVHGQAGQGLVSVLRPNDTTSVPDEGHEAVVVTTCVPAGSKPDAAATGRLLDAAATAVPDLHSRLLWKEVRTPADYAHQTGAPGGAVAAPALAGAGGAYLARANVSTVKGLYAVGGWAHPGGGLAHTGMSGALAAGLIVEGDSWRGST